MARPPKYYNSEELQEKISEYFESGVKLIDVVVGKGDNKEVIKLPVPTSPQISQGR